MPRKRNIRGREAFGPPLPAVYAKPGEVFEAALSGDKIAAQEALATVCGWVAHSKFHGEPLPADAADYLHHALRRMTYGDKQPDGSRKKVSGDEAFNLSGQKAKGAKHWTLKDKRLAVATIRDIMGRDFIDKETGIKFNKTLQEAIDFANANEIYEIAQFEKLRVSRATDEISKFHEMQFSSKIEEDNRLTTLLNESKSPWSNFFEKTPDTRTLMSWWGAARKRSKSSEIK